MSGSLPRQTRRCTEYAWCGGHVRGADAEHRSAPLTIPVQEGRTLLLSLVVEGGAPPQVEVEVKLSPNGPPMRVAMLDPAEVLSAGAALRRLAMMSQQRAGDDDLFPASD